MSSDSTMRNPQSIRWHLCKAGWQVLKNGKNQSGRWRYTYYILKVVREILLGISILRREKKETVKWAHLYFASWWEHGWDGEMSALHEQLEKREKSSNSEIKIVMTTIVKRRLLCPSALINIWWYGSTLEQIQRLEEQQQDPHTECSKR